MSKGAAGPRPCHGLLRPSLSLARGSAAGRKGLETMSDQATRVIEAASRVVGRTHNPPRAQKSCLVKSTASTFWSSLSTYVNSPSSFLHTKRTTDAEDCA